MRVRARLAVGLAWSFWVVVTVAGQGTLGPEPIPVDREPRHRVVFATPGLRVLEVNISARDTTLEHRHDFDLATVNIENGPTRTRDRGSEWGGVRPRTIGGVNFNEYTGKPLAHVVQTVDDRTYRLTGVENLRMGGWTTTPAVTGEYVTVTGESRAFRAYELRLPEGASVTHTHPVPVLVTVVDGGVRVVADGTVRMLEVSGAWSVVDAGRPHAVTASAAARVVEIEVR